MARAPGAQRKKVRRAGGTEAPAYWLREGQRNQLAACLEQADSKGLAGLIRTETTEVPRPTQEIDTTLVGELLNLLSSAGAPFPAGLPTPYGTVVMLSRDDADAAREAIDRVLSEVSDEDLANDETLILYAGEPRLARRGIEYLARALKIPTGYDSLLLMLR